MRPILDINAPLTLSSPSTLALIVANIVPAAGLLFWDWNMGDVLFLGWGEAAVVGIYSLIKIGMIERRMFLLLGPLVTVAFAFILFWLLGLILMISHEINMHIAGSYRPQDLAALARDVAPALAVFVVSHGVSFVLDFMGRQQYRSLASKQVGKDFCVHLAPPLTMAIAAGFVVAVFGNVGVLFVIIIVVKLSLEVLVHLNGPSPAELQ